MDIASYDQREKQLELSEKLVEIEELRKSGIADLSAQEVGNSLRSMIQEHANV